MKFRPREVRVAFPGGSQLRQSRATQPIVHAGCLCVFIIHRTLTWTTGSLTCTQMLMQAFAQGGVRTHVRGPGHSAKSAGGRLHLNTYTPFTHRSRSGLTMPLSRQSVGIYQETSSHATRQGTLGYSRLSSLSHCGLILV